MRKWPLFLGIGSVLFLGLFFFGLGARNLWRAFRSPSWPTAPAVVAASETRVSKQMYTADLRFRYQVNGTDYQTDLIYVGQTAGSGDASEAELRRLRYPLGARLTVYYDPAEPWVATVHPGFQADVLWLPGAGLAFILPGIMALAFLRSGSSSGFKFGLVLFTLIFMTIGAIMLFYGGRELYRGHASLDWPTAKGAIVYSLRDSSTSKTRDEETGEVETTTTHAARVICKYTVDGQVYYSNVRRFGQLAGSDAQWADNVKRLYPEGREVTVWYRPQDPELATLEPGITDEAWWLPGAGAAFFLFGLAALVFGVPALTRFP